MPYWGMSPICQDHLDLLVCIDLAEMSSYILIFGCFITSLLDDIHVILRHIPYSSGSLGVCAYGPYREDESCYDIFGISSCFCEMTHWGISLIFQNHLEVVG